MVKYSKLDSIKSVALDFLHMPVESVTNLPFIVQHPVFEYADFNAGTSGEMNVVNVLDESGKEIAVKFVEDRISNAEDVLGVYFIIRKSYRLAFLKYIKDYLNSQDFSELLAHSWVASENPNDDPNLPIDEAIDWFREAHINHLMTEDDYAVYQSLPDKLTVYRGVGVGRNPKGLSFTTDYDTAHWFAHRFDRDDNVGFILCADIDKSQVLAYFNTRDEKELVVDTTNVMFKIK